MSAPFIDELVYKYLVMGVKDHAIFALDPVGKILTWNEGAENIKGYSADDVIGKHFSLLYTEEARSRKHPDFVLAEALKNGSYEEEGWRVRKDGQNFWANVVITALYDADGQHIGFTKVTRDLTALRHATENAVHVSQKLATSEETFALMVSAVKDYAIFALSPEGFIKTWNIGAERIKGYTAEEILGKHFSIFYTEQAKAINHPAFELAQALEYGAFEEEGWRIRKDGSQIWVSVTITRVLDKNGTLTGYVKVTRDLTEKRQNELALERAKDEAILANQLKSKLVANITHEIRTPLTGILGLSQLMQDDPHATPDLRDSCQRIFDASKQLLSIINDLLDFAKLEAGKIDVENISFNPGAVADEVRGLLLRAASDKKLSLSLSIDKNVPEQVLGDPLRTRQVLLNLLSNAIKFTESGGVNITITIQDDSLLFAVTDTGIGISPDAQEKLFQPFVQAQESTARVFGGTGLGLSIAQQFVELMGGAIGLVSDPGEGTTVWFTLPLLIPVHSDE
ncbi:MAG: PAS domain S-box protein [Cyanobacteria bacterium REEB67]|nr:PAS domain S-box protein [Cyanobacteria bacterium REEB67]